MNVPVKRCCKLKSFSTRLYSVFSVFLIHHRRLFCSSVTFQGVMGELEKLVWMLFLKYLSSQSGVRNILYSVVTLLKVEGVEVVWSLG